MRLPADNKFVDENGRIVPSWREVLNRLEPLLGIATPTNVAALLALLGATAETDETGAIGDIQYRDASGFVNLPIGAIGALLGVNAAGNAPAWGGSAVWLNPIGDPLVPSAAASFQFTDIDQSYSHLFISFDQILQGTANGILSVSFDSSNTFGSLITVAGGKATVASGSGISGIGATGTAADMRTTNNTSYFSGFLILFNYTDQSKYKMALFGTAQEGVSPGNSTIGFLMIESTAVVNNLLFATSAGDMTGGSVSLSGIR